MYIQKVTLSLI